MKSKDTVIWHGTWAKVVRVSKVTGRVTIELLEDAAKLYKKGEQISSIPQYELEVGLTFKEK